MYNILHMSDIHYGKNIELEKRRLDALAEWIKKQNIEIKFLIFTGDMIDSREIRNQCVDRLKMEFPKLESINLNDNTHDIINKIRELGEECCKKYDEYVYDLTDKRMDEAGEIFKNFANTIKVDPSYIVICCGNHDCLQFAADSSSLECKKIDKDICKKQFGIYDKLCKKVNPRLSFATDVYKQDKCAFIIANTNWNIKENLGEKVCIGCSFIQSKFSETEDCDSCFFLAHKPIGDFCENTRYPYLKDKYITTKELIEIKAKAFFCGDKHAYVVNENDRLKKYMCGMPLAYEGTHYNLIMYDEEQKNIISSCFLTNYKDTWRMSATNNCLELIYNKSKIYLKGFSFLLINKDKNVPEQWDQTIKIVENNERMKQISKMMGTCIRSNTQDVLDSENIYHSLIDMIENSSKKQALSVKGIPGVGKSTLMSLVYIYILKSMYFGELNILPFYLDVRIVMNNIYPEDRCDVRKFTKQCVAKIERFISECKKLKEKYNWPMWIFITGLESCRLLDTSYDSLEKMVYSILDKSLDDSCDKYVMCLNQHDYGLDNSFDRIRDFYKNIYFNAVKVLPFMYEENERDIFLTSYMNLYIDNMEEQIVKKAIKRLEKLHSVDIDLEVLRYCLDDILAFKTNENMDNDYMTTWEALETKVNALNKIISSKPEDLIDKMQKIAGLLYSDKQRYIDILKDDALKDVSIPEFINLCDHPFIMRYLVATYYVKQLKLYSDDASLIPEDSILNCFITHDIAVMIRVILSNKYECIIREVLERFIGYHEKEMHGYLYSMIVYLCGHIKPNGGKELLEKIDEKHDKNEFWSYCEWRSYKLSQIACNANTQVKEEYLLELLNNDDIRRFNRLYQLYYYGDCSNHSIDARRQLSVSPKNKGFDFRSTFLILISKLEDAINKKIVYPLFEVDLYTICDFIYSRLQDHKEHTFFYSAKYNTVRNSKSIAVLDKTIFLLEKYTKSNKLKTIGKGPVSAYFEVMLDKFKDIKKLMECSVGKNVDEPYVSVVYDFEDICKLSRLRRVGWNIKNKTIKNNIDVHKGKNTFETIMEHVMESVYIAQMFLPEKLDMRDYDKHMIISVILYSELGRTSIGDYSPIYANVRDLASAENKKLKYFLTLGSLDGYAKQPMFFSSVRDSNNAEINIQIAREIKIIQMEYKYYKLYEKLGFKDERREDFENDFSDPSTAICRAIRKQLILDNPEFQKYFWK